MYFCFRQQTSTSGVIQDAPFLRDAFGIRSGFFTNAGSLFWEEVLSNLSPCYLLAIPLLSPYPIYIYHVPKEHSIVSKFTKKYSATA